MITYLVGDVRDRMAEIPDGSVSLVATSPPFIALRSYLPADHPDKGLEIGSEADPATYLDVLLELTAEWGRVLAPWGSIAVELGDTYAGSGGAGGDYNEKGLRQDQPKFSGSALSYRKETLRNRPQNGWPRAKCLALIPQLYATSLAYGRNILTGAPSPAGQWLVRNVIVWHRPNPAVGALGDKYRPSTSYITVATRSPKRWFDLTAVRHTNNRIAEDPGGYRMVAGTPNHDAGPRDQNPAGAPPLDTWHDEHDGHDCWKITTQPSSLAHYAMWPPKLAERLILSMCPLQVCATCGEARRRVEGVAEYVSTNGGRVVNQWAHQRVADNVNTWAVDGGNPGHAVRTAPTLGWSDCGHDNYRPGVTLDPFAGTGTTLAVADLHSRDAIGIDIDARNEALLPRRLAECKRALFGTMPELPGQQDLFGVPA